jgi:hypothetical protein
MGLSGTFRVWGALCHKLICFVPICRIPRLLRSIWMEIKSQHHTSCIVIFKPFNFRYAGEFQSRIIARHVMGSKDRARSAWASPWSSCSSRFRAQPTYFGLHPQNTRLSHGQNLLCASFQDYLSHFLGPHVLGSIWLWAQRWLSTFSPWIQARIQRHE